MSDREEPTVEGTATAANALVQNTTSRRIRPPPRLTMERRHALESLMSTSATAAAVGNNRNDNNSTAPPVNNPYLRNNNNTNSNTITTNSDGATDATNNNSNNNNNNNNSTNVRDRSSPWPLHTTKWFDTIKRDIEKQVHYKYGDGNPPFFNGKFPRKYMGIISPSSDPVSWFGTNRPLNMDQFLLPDVFVWYPEAQWQDFYPEGRPKCKWHKRTECVYRHGWMNAVRHGYAEQRIVGIIGMKYYCKTRETLGITPKYFRSIDRDVFNKTPTRPKRKRNPKRCRKCGLEIINHRDSHKVPPVPINDGQRHSVAYLSSQQVAVGYRVEDHCTVPTDMYSEGYPLRDGKKHPRRKKRRD